MFFVPVSLDTALEDAGVRAEGACSILGGVNPTEARNVWLSTNAIPRERWDDVIAHETCHSDLLTSSAYGHAQQMLFRYNAFLRNQEFYNLFGDKAESFLKLCLPLGKKLNSLSWFAHEGAAVAYGVIAWQRVRGTEETLKYYLDQHPENYQVAYYPYGFAMNQILATRRADSTLLAVLPNALAQYCLNSNVMDVVFECLRIGTIDDALVAALEEDSPNKRLAILLEIFDGQLVNALLDSYDSLKFRLRMEVRCLDLMEVNDLVNNCILTALDRRLPGKIAFFHSRDVLRRLKELFASLDLPSQLRLEWYDVSTDLEKRKNFTRYNLVD